MNIVVGVIVIITGALLNSEEVGKIGIYFWIGLVLDAVLLITFMQIVKSIIKNTKKIKDL